ncbi:L-threonine O-3-phosphate decarboxylase [Fontibacillus panacisegetis]|uniref:Aminotransferase n=1 Tax=Fontibacillus panacisegetis TaxID=670482 RepID=A0A1G7PWR2_9BACL|nr:threonine-phosphate decarboxylase [Fontibacillus panacisegetis]SDF90706.1 L-threonine O-3-phosphate decarboxylase [Fontibacillus panacisegetis]
MLLEVYGHGGDVKTASARFGVAAEEFTDLSANINPLGPPPGLLNKLREAMPDIVRYPDPGHRALLSQLGELLQVGEDCFVIGNGAAENMALALLALNPERVGIIEPCFSEYETLSRQFGARVNSVLGSAQSNFHADPDDIVGLIRDNDLVFIGQPNNPNGIQYGWNELRRFADAAESYSTYLVVDEAFIDFIPEKDRISLLGELHHYPRVILIRSMTKFYAIPGLRLGYAIAHPDLAAAMRGKQVTWSVNLLALLAGEFCLQAGKEYEDETITLITKQRQLLREGLAGLGCETWPGEANFLLVRLPEGWTALKMQEELGAKGILVRSCAMYNGLGERDIRVAVKDQLCCDKLLQAMRKVLETEE